MKLLLTRTGSGNEKPDREVGLIGHSTDKIVTEFICLRLGKRNTTLTMGRFF